MTSSPIILDSELNELFFSDVKVLYSRSMVPHVMANKMLELPSGEHLVYNEFFGKPVDTTLGPKRVFVLDRADCAEMEKAEKLFPNLTEFVKHHPAKTIYLRSFSSMAVERDERRRYFADEVLEIIPLLLARQGAAPQSKKLKGYKEKWSSERGYATIDTAELVLALNDFKIDKALLNIVPDIHYCSLAQTDFPRRFGNVTFHVISPDLKRVASVSTALFTIFKEIVTLVDWNHCNSVSVDYLRVRILTCMKKLVVNYLHAYIDEMDVVQFVTEFRKQSAEFQTETPHYLFDKCDFSDVMVFDGFMDLVTKFHLQNYRNLSLSKEECKKGELAMWKVNILLLLDWSDMFFDVSTPELKHLVLIGMQHLVPIKKWESDDDLMNVIFNLDESKLVQAVQLEENSAVLFDNMDCLHYTVKHMKNEFQVKRCRKWVYRDMIISRRTAGEPFDSPEIRQLMFEAQKDTFERIDKDREARKERAHLGGNLLRQLRISDKEKSTMQSEKTSEVKSVMEETWNSLEGQVRDVLTGKTKNKVLNLQLGGHSSKNPFSVTVHEEGKCSSKDCENERKELKSQKSDLVKAAKQAESKALKLKDKEEKEWKKKMEAKEKKWAEERKTLKEKLSAKERKSQEEKTALEMKVRELQQALEEKERQMEEKEKEMTEKVIDLQRKNENFERQVQHLRKAIPPPPKSQYSADVKARLIQLQSTRDQMIAENPSEKAAKMVRELLKVNENIKRGANIEMKKFNMEFRKYMTAIDETIRLIQSNPRIDIADVPEMPPFPKLCDELEKTYEKDVLQKKATNFEFDISDDSGASTSSSSASSSSSSSPPSSTTSSDEHDDECPICLCTIEEKEHDHKCDVCRARYHAICSSDWLFKNSTCPNCRSRMVDPAEFPDLK